MRRRRRNANANGNGSDNGDGDANTTPKMSKVEQPSKNLSPTFDEETEKIWRNGLYNRKHVLVDTGVCVHEILPAVLTATSPCKIDFFSFHVLACLLPVFSRAQGASGVEIVAHHRVAYRKEDRSTHTLIPSLHDVRAEPVPVVFHEDGVIIDECYK